MSAVSLSGVGPRRRAGSPPVEYSLLLTATLCLLAFGAVMVFSASSTTSLLGTTGDSAYYLKRTLVFGAIGLLVMRGLAGRDRTAIRRLTPVFVVCSLFGLIAVLVPGVGVTVNGAQRWLGAGPLQIQPSEIAKLALVLYGAHLLAERPRMVTSVRAMGPYLLVVAFACGLVVAEPDLGTAIVASFAAAATLVAAGARVRTLALLAGLIGAVILLIVVVEPYRMARITGFLHPTSDPSSVGYQAIQAKIALGSGGIFGAGLGQSLQKAYFLPEAHTDMIAAVIGEELGLVGITVLVGLYGLFGYAGLRTAQKARDRYGKLLAAGITSLICGQAIVNLFAVLGLAPLTGVPLPFVSYGNSSLIVTLAAVGLLLGVARRPAATASAPARLRVVEGGRVNRRAAPSGRTARSAQGRDSSRRNSRPRSAGAGSRRRASRSRR
jgi:cell division protein FtsW